MKNSVVPVEETINLPLYISFYVENGYIIMNFNKRIILNDSNKVLWVDLLNTVADGVPVSIPCALTARDTMMAKMSLKKLGLLKKKLA